MGMVVRINRQLMGMALLLITTPTTQTLRCHILLLGLELLDLNRSVTTPVLPLLKFQLDLATRVWGWAPITHMVLLMRKAIHITIVSTFRLNLRIRSRGVIVGSIEGSSAMATMRLIQGDLSTPAQLYEEVRMGRICSYFFFPMI